MLTQLAERVLPEICAHACDSWPEECCGWASAVHGVVRCANVAGELHARDPASYERDGRTAYVMTPADQLRLFREIRPGDIIYHSHCETSAYFSETDRARATLGGEPIYPKVGQLVVSVVGGRAQEARLYCWDGTRWEFVQACCFAIPDAAALTPRPSSLGGEGARR